MALALRRIPILARDILGLGAVCAIAVACGNGSSSSGELTGTTSADIIGGTNSTTAQNSVVLIVQPVGTDVQVNCSGTLLAPKLVLTARHCVSNTSDQGFSCNKSGVGTAGGDIQGDVDPTTLYIFTGATRATKFSEAAAHGAKIFHDDGTNLCDHDLALLLLDTAITDMPYAPIRLTTNATVSESIEAVGWGVTTDTLTPSTRQQRTVNVERVGPDRDDANQLDIPPHEFEVGESICQGDSGGPAFDTSTGAVVGVVSRGGNDSTPDPNNPAASCTGASNFYSEPSNFVDTIKSAYAAAGQSPWLEGGPKPTTCGVVDGAALCSYDCSAEACPTGYACSGGDSGTPLCVATDAPAAGSSSSSSGGCAVGARNPSGEGGGGSIAFAIAATPA